MLEKGYIISDRYEVDEKIGAGGMAVVYKAHCNKLDRDVAIKVLRDEYLEDENFIKKFKSEAVQASKLTHPNIVSIYDVGFDNNVYYIVMEYIKGNTLKKVLQNNAEIDMRSMMDIVIKVADALKCAHDAGIIHRDIKTQNIIISDNNNVKVADFGIATATTSSTLSVTTNAIGSVHYFSPEQAKGEMVDLRSDIYSFGILMFEVFTKSLPFEGDSPVSVALKHVLEEVPQPSKRESKISLNLDRIILKAANREPNERYADMKELILDLKTEYDSIKTGVKVRTQESIDSLEKEPAKSSWAVVNFEGKKNRKDEQDALEKKTEANMVENEMSEVEEIASPEEIESIFDAAGEEQSIDGQTVVSKDQIVNNINNKQNEEIELMDINHGSTKIHPVDKKLQKVKNEIGPREADTGISEEEEEALRALKGDDGVNNDKMVYISAVITALVIIGLISYFGIMYIQGFQKSLIIEAPNLIGMDFEKASEELKAKEIELEKIEEKYSTKAAKGEIIDQNPKQGQKIQKNSKIEVTVSKGAGEIVIPDVVGEEVENAKEILEIAGFTVKIQTSTNITGTPGEVTSQSPVAGEKAAKSSTVKLTVIGEPVALEEKKETIVPNVTNISVDAAKDAIKAAGLKVGMIAYEASTKVPKDIVISQSMKAGTKVDTDSIIDLVISTGKAKTVTNIGETPNGTEPTPVKPTPDTITNTPTTSGGKSIEVELNPIATTGKTSASVMIMKISDSKVNLVYSREHLLADFPFKYKVEGKAGDIVKVYIDGNVQVEDVIK